MIAVLTAIYLFSCSSKSAKDVACMGDHNVDGVFHNLRSPQLWLADWNRCRSLQWRYLDNRPILFLLLSAFLSSKFWSIHFTYREIVDVHFQVNMEKSLYSTSIHSFGHMSLIRAVLLIVHITTADFSRVTSRSKVWSIESSSFTLSHIQRSITMKCSVAQCSYHSRLRQSQHTSSNCSGLSLSSSLQR